MSTSKINGSSSNTSRSTNFPLSKIARDAVARHPNSDIEVGMAFCPVAFRAESNDRLLKLGRQVSSLIRDMSHHKPNDINDDNITSDDDEKLEASLQMLYQECEILTTPGPLHVPKVRFGKTGLQMPIVTLGCMRFQQEWGPRITHMNQVGSDCQDNLVEILRTAIVRYGINHIETARGYGCSELQLGVALQQLYATTTPSIQRKDLIIQTKVPPFEDAVAFREALVVSLKNLQVDYVDLFAFHGMNYDEQFDWVFGEQRNNCLSVVKEFMAAGKIRHLGFSTHGSTDFIMKCINTDVFEYVNLHYHYFGSYVTSGGGHDGNGNLDCVKLLAEKDIGRFIISPYDKGGRLYAPSKKLRSLTLPEMEPMTFGSLWIWNHHRIYDEHLPQLHTFTVGAARPSDLDRPAIAAYLHATQPDDILAKIKRVTIRLDMAKEQALGKEWMQTWWMGLPKSTGSKYLVEHNQIVWIYNCIKAFGLYDFGKTRYNSFEKNEEKWDESLTDEQNIEQKIGKNPWGFVPGRPLKPDVDYMECDLQHVPAFNKARVLEAEDFVYSLCRDTKLDKNNNNKMLDESEGTRRRAALSRALQFLKRNSTTATGTEGNNNAAMKSSVCDSIREILPTDWEPAYDMRTWPDFPDQPSRGN